VMIGEAPHGEEFNRQFDWPDAVIHVPFNSPDIGRILAELDGDPDRLNAVRHRNVREAALRHDWVHRIRAVFDVLGLAPTDEMQARALSITVVIFYWRICLMSESIGHHDSEIMDDGNID